VASTVAPLGPFWEGAFVWQMSAGTYRGWSGLPPASECAGFRVETSQGLLGVLEELHHHGDRAHDLVVRAGKQGARLLIVPVDEVAELVPDERRVILRLPFRLTTSERLPARIRRAAAPGV
jgi:hypothetical protein